MRRDGAEGGHGDCRTAADRVGDHEAALHFREIAADEARHRDSFQVELKQLEKSPGSNAP